MNVFARNALKFGRITIFSSFLCVTLSVSATEYYVDDSRTTNGPLGTSWPGCFNNLQSALSAAAGNPGGAPHIIKVAQGIYRPHASDRDISFVVTNDLYLRGGYPGYNQSNPDDQDPNLFDDTILSGDLSNNDTLSIVSGVPTFANTSDNSYHVVQGGTSLDPSCIVEGFKITGGDASANNNVGGGMYFQSGGNIVRNCIIAFNQAHIGAGINCDGATGAEFRDCTFYANKAGYYGGGFFSYGNAKFVSSTFDTNYAAVQGGGVWVSDGTQFDFVNCIIKANRATAGAGVFAIGGLNTIVSNYTNCLVVGNSATAGYGGGICDNCKMTIRNCTIADNYASLGGGGINFDLDTTGATMISSIVYGNTAGSGNAQIRDQYNVLNVTYSDVQGGWGGSGTAGNLNTNPMFVGSGDYHLSCPSLCINAGQNSTIPADSLDVNKNSNTTEQMPVDLGFATRIIEIVDMGSYETQFDGCPGEANGFLNTNGVNVDDLLAVINNWGSCPAPCMADLVPQPCGNGVVDVDDLLAVINNWGLICATGLNGGGGGSISSVQDCMDAASLDYEPYSPEWDVAVNRCVDALCAAELIECDE